MGHSPELEMRNWIKARGSARKSAAKADQPGAQADPAGRPDATASSGAAGSSGSAGSSGGSAARSLALESGLAQKRVQALEAELARHREQAAAAALESQKIAQHEATIARRALEEAGEARLERDEYRRVLAAAIANEKKSLEEARTAREAYDLVEGRLAAKLAEAHYARGIADGRARELERSKAELMARHATDLGELRDREWAEREERRREVQRLLFELGDARATVRALQARLGPEPALGSAAHARAAATRRAIASALAVFCGLLALALAPAAIIAAVAPGRAAYLTLALGLGPWALVLSAAGFGLVALGCATLALRAERARTADDRGSSAQRGAESEGARSEGAASGGTGLVTSGLLTPGRATGDAPRAQADSATNGALDAPRPRR
ncbi:MAG: hypothetical protein R3F49_15410 [Planctomycetota bacterium]